MRRPQESDFTAPAHDVRVSARLGLWLGIAFALCFLTGLLSHEIQHPASWFIWPTRPVDLYRVTQGIHVLSGIAAIPLLLFKLWSVYPKLFARPAVRSLPHALERGSLLVLLGATFFELSTGLFNVAQSYPWHFFFPAAHYAAGFLLIGALLVHVGAKLPKIRDGLRVRVTNDPPAPEAASTVSAGESPDVEGLPKAAESALSRRGFLGAAGVSAGVAVLATAGATVPGLRDISVLGWRSDKGPQGLPVNRTAAGAGVTPALVGPDWRLTITWPTGTHALSRADLESMPQTTAELPIACVEGWSQNARWTGVRLRDVLTSIGCPLGFPIHLASLDHGLYGSSTLPAPHVRDPLTLLALRLGDQDLHMDHGYPCRLIAPSRPGVLQTKWLSRLTVLT